uniref:Uncharacterized protein n=1 Tax=Calidris pygmaea TaxID=425635 RepID=A0A8C3JF04_9CHAR
RKKRYKSLKSARYLPPGSCWGTTAATRAGWPTAASATPSPGRGNAAAPTKQPSASWASPTKSTSCTVSTASERTTENT